MFSESLQEILARYSDPSRNPYAHVLQSQAFQTHTGPSSQYLTQTLHSGRDVSCSVNPGQSGQRLMLDVETLEQSPEDTFQVFDSQGCYIQSPALSPQPQPFVQQVLPVPTNCITSSRRTGDQLSVFPVPVHDTANMIHKPLVSDVPGRLWFTHYSCADRQNDISSTSQSAFSDDVTNVLSSPPSTIQRSIDESLILETSRKAKIGSASTGKENVDKGEAERREAERIESERYESGIKETKKREESSASAATNTPKLARIERKLNNKDLVMGWYQSINSSELRYPHECISTEIGDIYVHTFKKAGKQKFQLWVRQISRGVTIWAKAHIFHIHPKLVDRRLTLSATGEPHWVTRTSLMASGSRERAGKVADMIHYN